MSDTPRTELEQAIAHERAARLDRQLEDANEAVRTLRGDLHAERATNKVLTADVERLEREVDQQTRLKEELPNAIWLAKFLHDTYERLAPQYGYVTRQDTRTFDHESPNGRLMAAVCEELRRELSPPEER